MKQLKLRQIVSSHKGGNIKLDRLNIWDNIVAIHKDIELVHRYNIKKRLAHNTW